MFFKPRLGLVFSGGGGRGAYQIGVWQSLRETGLDRNISVVSGTSVGALNALLFAQNDFERAQQLWQNITTEQILSGKNNSESFLIGNTANDGELKKTLSGISFFSRSGLMHLLETSINVQKLKRKLFVCATNIGSEISTARTLEAAYAFIKRKNFGVPVYFNCSKTCKEDLMVRLLASSAIPLVFEAEEINNELYYDGGLTAHLPVAPVYEMGIQQIIVVNLFDTIPLKLSDYPGIGITYIEPQSNLGSAITSSLTFNGENCATLIETGYRESLPILQKLATRL